MKTTTHKEIALLLFSIFRAILENINVTLAKHPGFFINSRHVFCWPILISREIVKTFRTNFPYC
jgi:hypothetical protein